MLLGDRGGVANVAWISGTTACPPNVNATDPNAFITPNTRSAVDSPCDSCSPALAGAVAVAASSPPHLSSSFPIPYTLQSSTGQGETPQISSAYERIVLSLLKKPLPAVDRMDDLAQAVSSLYFLSTSFCASMYATKSLASR